MAVVLKSAKAEKLLLDSLEIRGFKAFEHLRIEKLGRVNLIVGKNNVGKSSLLEALQLYAYQGSPEIIWQILSNRDEGRLASVNYTKPAREQLLALKNLFHGRPDVWKQHAPIQLGRADSLINSLSISIEFGLIGEEEIHGGVRSKWKPRPLEAYSAGENIFPGLVIREGEKIKLVHRLDSPPSNLSLVQNLLFTCLFVLSSGLRDDEVSELWDAITLTPEEEDVIAALHLIAPEIERLNIVGNQEAGEEWQRIPKVKLSGFHEPIPLGSLGGGMKRLFSIALGLTSAQDGMLLLDEIENGLHYSIQPDVWRFIFAAARRLNVQVFATTHSWDCIEAFQAAAQEATEDEGVLIRLENKKGKIVSTMFDERRLEIATREAIEVR